MRAFVAIALPEHIHEALARQQAELRAVCPEARWVKPAGIHLTLKFLGEISETQVKAVTEGLALVAPFESFEVEVKGFGFFPDTRRPRVLWVGIAGPKELSALADEVEGAMAKLGFPRENRPFTPHLTLARFPSPRAQPTLQAALATLRAGPAEDRSLGRFPVSEFFLFESKLSPHGAEYRKVARFPQP